MNSKTCLSEIFNRTTLIAFDRSSWSKLAYPEDMWVSSIAKEIVCFRCLLFVGFIQSVKIACWFRIESIDITAILLLPIIILRERSIKSTSDVYLRIDIVDQGCGCNYPENVSVCFVISFTPIRLAWSLRKNVDYLVLCNLSKSKFW